MPIKKTRSTTPAAQISPVGPIFTPTFSMNHSSEGWHFLPWNFTLGFIQFFDWMGLFKTHDEIREAQGCFYEPVKLPAWKHFWFYVKSVEATHINPYLRKKSNHPAEIFAVSWTFAKQKTSHKKPTICVASKKPVFYVSPGPPCRYASCPKSSCEASWVGWTSSCFQLWKAFLDLNFGGTWGYINSLEVQDQPNKEWLVFRTLGWSI